MSYITSEEHLIDIYSINGTNLLNSSNTPIPPGEAVSIHEEVFPDVFQLGTCTISWRCCKQWSVATSTTEAEYMAVTMAVKHHLWLRQALKELLIEDISAHLFCDNNSTIDYCHNSRVSDCTKHIDITYHFVKE